MFMGITKRYMRIFAREEALLELKRIEDCKKAQAEYAAKSIQNPTEAGVPMPLGISTIEKADETDR